MSPFRFVVRRTARPPHVRTADWTALGWSMGMRIREISSSFESRVLVTFPHHRLVAFITTASEGDRTGEPAIALWLGFYPHRQTKLLIAVAPLKEHGQREIEFAIVVRD